MPTITPGTTIPRTDLMGSFTENTGAVDTIAAEVFPDFETPDQSGSFGVTPMAAHLSDQNVDRAMDGSYPRSTWKLEDASYKTVEYGHEERLDDRKSKMFRNFFDFEMTRAVRIRNILRRKRAIRVAALLHNTTTLPLSGTTGLAITDEWDDKTNAIPVDNIAFGLQCIRDRGGDASRAILQISWRAQYDLSRTNQIRSVLAYTKMPEGLIPLNDLAQALGVRKVIAASAQKNTANDGLAESLADVYHPEYAALVVPPSGLDIEEPCFGRSFYWTGDGGGTPDEPALEEYYEDARRGSVLRGRHDVQEKVLFSGAAFLFGNCYTA
jgi:hypothetical protein